MVVATSDIPARTRCEIPADGHRPRSNIDVTFTANCIAGRSESEAAGGCRTRTGRQIQVCGTVVRRHSDPSRDADRASSVDIHASNAGAIASSRDVEASCAQAADDGYEVSGAVTSHDRRPRHAQRLTSVNDHAVAVSASYTQRVDGG